MPSKIFLQIFVIMLIWTFCSTTSAYDSRCLLGGHLYITIKNKTICTLLVAKRRGTYKVQKEDREKMSILGIIGYLVLVPIMLLYFADIWLGKYPSFWLVLLFFLFCILLIVDALDFVVGYFIIFIGKSKKNKMTPPLQIIWDIEPLATEPEKERAEEIFRSSEKIIWNKEKDEYLFMKNKYLLRLGSNGQFITISTNIDSPEVLKAMRVGNVIWR